MTREYQIKTVLVHVLNGKTAVLNGHQVRQFLADFSAAFEALGIDTETVSELSETVLPYRRYCLYVGDEGEEFPCPVLQLVKASEGMEYCPRPCVVFDNHYYAGENRPLFSLVWWEQEIACVFSPLNN